MYSIKTSVFLVFPVCSFLEIDANDDANNHYIYVNQTAKQNIFSSKLNMTLCSDKCVDSNCKTYMTPIDICYSSDRLFPHDPSWSGKDVRDIITSQTQTLVRTIFFTENSTCNGSQDTFHIPLNECVGPFGKPRPWGVFNIVQGLNESIRKFDDCDIGVSI